MAKAAQHIFCFGLGYCARALGQELMTRGWDVSGTLRDQVRASGLQDEGFRTHLFDPGAGTLLSRQQLEQVTHILVSIPPGERGDPVINFASEQIRQAAKHLQWIGYFSTTGVYGDHGGGLVDETTLTNPSSERGKRRVRAEHDWQALADEINVPLSIFRLPGIYGPGRNAFVSLKKGTARRIIKKDQVFGRVHLDDIIQSVLASIETGEGGIYNVVDDEPAPPQDVISYAAELLGIEPPPETDLQEADLSPMARSFYSENKRVKNERIKVKLGVTLKYPDYRAGLRALFKTLS